MGQEYLLHIGDSDYRVTVESCQDGEARVLVDGRPITVRFQSIDQPPARRQPAPPAVSATPVATVPVQAAAKPSAASGGKTLRAPMPGVIRQILVKAGDLAKAGQPLAVMEAMKMENQLVAPADGRVASVAVAVGASVNTGDLILSLE